MDLVLNIVVSVLLVIIIILFIIFSRRIATFNASKKELASFLEDFQASILRAERNINELKSMGDKVDENLKSQIKKARFLANDLSYLAEKGESVANSLDQKISQSRNAERKSNIMDSKPVGKPTTGAAAIVSGSSGGGSVTLSKNQMSPNKKQALDALLKQIAKKKSEIS